MDRSQPVYVLCLFVNFHQDLKANFLYCMEGTLPASLVHVDSSKADGKEVQSRRFRGFCEVAIVHFQHLFGDLSQAVPSSLETLAGVALKHSKAFQASSSPKKQDQLPKSTFALNPTVVWKPKHAAQA